MHRTTRSAAQLLGVGVVAAAMTACGQQYGPIAAVSTSSVTQTVTSSTTHARTADRCTTEALTVALGHGSGTAGHFYIPVTFTNNSAAACTITGYPGVSYVTGKGGDQIGDAAARSNAATPTVTLHPGQQASATVDQVDVANYPAGSCQPVDAAGLRVYPPNDTVPVFLTEPHARACAKHMPTQQQLSVRPVKETAAQPPAS